MFNLYQLVTGAQGGRGLDNLAERFGLKREDADRAVKALLPALSTAFMARAAQPGGLMGLAAAMNEHRPAYAGPQAAQAAQAARNPGLEGRGAELARSLFGNDAVLGHVTRTAAQFAGVPEATVAAMLPLVVSTVLGGGAESMHAQGMGGMLGELAQGGLGSMVGHIGGPGSFGGGLMSGSQAGFGGMLGSIMANFFGGAGQTGAQTGQAGQAGQAGLAGQAAATGGAQAGAESVRPGDPASALPPMMQAGIDQLFKMFQPGTAGMGGAGGANPFGNLGEMLGGAFARR